MFFIQHKNELFQILVLAILVRVLLMPFYFHPDIKTYNFQASFLRMGIFDIYSYTVDNKDRLPIKEEFVYFPLAYFFLGSYQILASPFLGNNFYTWLSDASLQAYETAGVYRYLFILKLPYLLLDIVLAFILTSLVKEIKQKKAIFIAWLFNPFSIILIYVFSNIDIIPVTLSVTSLYFIKQKKYWVAALLLGLGAGFKAYTLLFVPFLLLLTQSLKQKLIVSLVSFGAFTICILPFLGSSSFRQSTLLSGLTTRIISPGIGIGFGEVLMPAIIVLSIMFFYEWQNKKIEKNIVNYYLTSVLLIFSLIHFHIQWLLWMMPFAVLLISKVKTVTYFVTLLIIIAFLIPLLSEDKFMSVSLLRVINPIFSQIPSPYLIIQKLYDPFVIQGMLHSILLGGSIVLSLKVLKLNYEDDPL